MRVDEFKQFVVHGFGARGIAGANGLRSAMAKMVAHEGASDGAESLLYRGNLDEDVGTVAVVGDHAFEAADLSFDATEALAIGGFDFGIDGDGFAFGGVGFAAAGGLRDTGDGYGHFYIPPRGILPMRVEGVKPRT